MGAYVSDYEDAVMQTLLPRLESEGFFVFVRPSSDMLPLFMRGMQPDAIAFKGDRKVAIEVTPKTRPSRQSIRSLQDAFSEHPDWEFRVIYAPPRPRPEPIPAQTREVIDRHLARVEASLQQAGPSAALLAAWAAFEAAARRASGGDMALPQDAGLLLDRLASDGAITPAEADRLRPISHLRNAVAHGRLDEEPSQDQVEDLMAITRTVLDLAG